MKVFITESKKPLCIVACLLIAVCPWFYAHADGMSEKHELLQDARLVFHKQPTAQQYTVTLSTIKKVNGQWRARKERRLDALVERKTYELDARFRGVEALRLLRDHLSRQPMLQLFVCEGLDCGSSNAWANEILQIKQLYGVDQTQFYTVLQGQNARGQDSIQIYYLVARGNGRVMLQEDMLVLASSAAQMTETQSAQLFDRLIAEHKIEIPGVEIRNGAVVWHEENAAQVRDLLKRLPRKKVYIVGHDNTALSFQKNVDQSQRYADSVRESLVAMGIDENRLDAVGAGSIAIGRSTRLVKIELFLE